MNKRNLAALIICACILVTGMIITLNEVSLATTNYSCSDWIICIASSFAT